MTTDADSTPASDWVAAGVQALRFADLATGTVLRHEPHELQDRVEAYFDRLHRYRRTVDPVTWDTVHGRHFSGAANFAIRGSVYIAMGGFEELEVGEDAALIDAASRAGYRVRRDPAMTVTTSSRREGRVRGGLASSLRGLDRYGLPMVDDPAAAAWQYRAQARARLVFGELEHSREDVAWLARATGLAPDHILDVARDCPNDEAFAMRIVPAAPHPIRSIPLDEAEAALDILEQPIRWKLS